MDILTIDLIYSVMVSKAKGRRDVIPLLNFASACANPDHLDINSSTYNEQQAEEDFDAKSRSHFEEMVCYVPL